MNRAPQTLSAIAIGLVVFLPALVVQAADERIVLPNGDIYQGDVVDGARTGRGVYAWADGHRYEGEFVNNRMEGQGRYHWPDGRNYNLHGNILRDMGVYIGELWTVEELAADCAEDGRYEFFICAPPLHIPGAVGSPLNPIAIK